jgi:outer membrane biosynthesis protein TonB
VEGFLRPRRFWAGLALGFILMGTVVVPVKLVAQEAAAEVTKRKVKTRISPEYSGLARQMKVTGKVKNEVTISPDGHVTGSRTVGGNPLLVAASLDASKNGASSPARKKRRKSSSSISAANS